MSKDFSVTLMQVAIIVPLTVCRAVSQHGGAAVLGSNPAQSLQSMFFL